jgi:WD40 repeat protein
MLAAVLRTDRAAILSIVERHNPSLPMLARFEARALMIIYYWILFRFVASIPGKLLTIGALRVIVSCALLLSACASTVLNAAAKGIVVPPNEWSWLPSWSKDGRLIAVDWPAPDQITAKGKIFTAVHSKSSKNPSAGIMICHAPTTLASADGQYVALAHHFDEQKTIILNAKTFESLPVSIPGGLTHISWSPDGRYLAGHGGRSSDDCDFVYDGTKGTVALRLPASKVGFRNDFMFAPDSNRIAISRVTGIDVWDVAKRTKLYSIPELHGYGQASIDWSPDGSFIAACGSSSSIGMNVTALRVCAADTGKVSFGIDDEAGIGGASWSPDGKLFIYSDKNIHILASHTMKEVCKLELPENATPAGFALSPDGRRLAYKGNDPDLHVFDLQAMHEVTSFPAEKSGRFQFSWSPDSKYLMIADSSNQIAICYADTGHYMGSKQFQDGFAEWSADGKAVVLFISKIESVQFVPILLDDAAIPVFSGGTPGNPWEHQHVLKNLDDCFEELMETLPAETVEQIKKTKEKDLCLYTGGPSLGMALRNTWGLSAHTPIVQYFNKLGITDGAAMSTVIIESFWKHLNGKPIDLTKQVADYRFAAECGEPIIAEKRQLPDAIVNLETTDLNGNSLCIAKQAAKVRIVSFVCTRYIFSASLLRCLRDVRNKYPVDKVSMAVFTFTPEALGLNDQKVDTRATSDAEIAATIAECKSTIPFAPGSQALMTDLKQFTRGRLYRWSRGLPQTLVINEAGMVTTRLNGWYFEDTIEPLQKAVDGCLHGEADRKPQASGHFSS